MNSKQISTILDNMLSTPKTKNFLNHLVRSYIPMTKVDKVWQVKDKDNFKCVLTRDDLFSVDDILIGMETEEFKTGFTNSLKTMFEDDNNTPNPILKFIGDKKMGLTGKDTTTYMSYTTYQEFYNWVRTKILCGDKHINWLVGKIRHELFTENNTKTENDIGGNKTSKHNKETAKLATYTLGESSDVLLTLKKKLESNE
jgi:hypothetical protein